MQKREKTRKLIARIVFDAMMIAVYVVLARFLVIPTPIVEISIVSVPILLSAKLFGKVGASGGNYALHILFTNDCAIDGNYAKDLFRRLVHTVHICVLVTRLNVQGALLEIYLEYAVGRCAAAQLLCKR